jgi:hypothetical protein
VYGHFGDCKENPGRRADLQERELAERFYLQALSIWRKFYLLNRLRLRLGMYR